MSAPALEEDNAFPPDTADAGVYSTHASAFEHSLVLLAMGADCWLVASPAGHHLRVPASVLPEARYQLALFDRESAGWPPPKVAEPDPAPSAGARRIVVTPLLWVLAIFAVFEAQARAPGLTAAGALDAERVLQHGEAWRAFTALWLHADLGHLVSNAGGGLLVFSALVATFGVRAAWTRLALAAVAGNALSVVLHHGGDYRSLGASTAVFAGLGLLVGRALRRIASGLVAGRDTKAARPWRAFFPPLAAGLAVLGLFGAGEVRVDVLAHATGFAAGLLAGFVREHGHAPGPARAD